MYVATDRGAFWARTDLEGASLPSLSWVSLTDSLPQVAATDVRLDPAGVQLYISLVGYGVYATAAIGAICAAMRRATSSTTSRATPSPLRAAAKMSLASYGGRKAFPSAAAMRAASAATPSAEGSRSSPAPDSAQSTSPAAPCVPR